MGRKSKGSTPPRRRAPNFTEAEIKLLVDIAYSYRSVIECKKSDGTVWGCKEQAWRNVTEKFNRVNVRGVARTTQTLHDKYESLKTKVRSKVGQEGDKANGTGFPLVYTPYEKKILDMITDRADELEGLFDLELRGEPRREDLHDEITYDSSCSGAESEEHRANTSDDWGSYTHANVRAPVTAPFPGNVVENGVDEDAGSGNTETNTSATPEASSAMPRDDLTVEMDPESFVGTVPDEEVLQKPNHLRRHAKSKKREGAFDKISSYAEKKKALTELETEFVKKKIEFLEREHHLKMEILLLQKSIEYRKLEMVELDLKDKRQ